MAVAARYSSAPARARLPFRFTGAAAGFQESHRVKDFFIDNYDHPMFENGVRLKDMIYLERNFLTAED